MTSMNSITPGPIFTKLAPRISIYGPPEHATGQLIIICTWLGAARKHINKYILSYTNIAPCSKILLIESAVPIIISSYATQHKAIKPAVQAVRAVLEECGYSKDSETIRPPRILLHTFSNGGTNSATQMLLVLNEQLGAPLPLVGTICDSGPAKGDYWKSYNAMVLSLPKGIARAIGPIIVHFILIGLFASIAAGRYEKPEDLVRRKLLDPNLIASPKPKAQRRICYIFSKADKMVEWEDVVGHANTARANGWAAEEVLFEETAHCNHFSPYAEVYADHIRQIWCE